MYEDLKLPEISKGAHAEGSGQLCAMELVAFMERLPHSDRPPCTCPVLAQYTRTLNDRMPNKERQKLLPVLPRLVGAVNPGLEQKRAEHFAMAVVTRLVPLVLDGRIDAHLVAAMREAKTLEEADAAANAAADAAADAAANAANAAAYAAYAAANAAANAANAAADAAANAANAAAYAADAAANAANAAANAAAYAADAAAADFWDMAVQLLVEAIELDPAIKPAVWTHDRAEEAVAVTA